MELLRQEYRSFRIAIEEQVWQTNVRQQLAPAAADWWDDVLRRHNRVNETPERRLAAFELLYCYFLEEGGLVQTIETIALRFQNKAQGAVGPLMRLDITPLRGVADFLWAFIDDQYRRLGVRRRALEYMSQYGLPLEGRATKGILPAEQRSRFLHAFHTLLNTCTRYFREVDDNTVVEDAFPVLAALRELHLVLAEGAHNQFGTLTLQARVEMIIVQRLLERPEFQRFLGGSPMIPFPEGWMDRVDTMRRMMRWGDTSIVEFWNLAVAGEELLLTIRYGPFGPNQNNPQEARGWANALRPTITRYVHAYRAVTGVDLSADMVNGRSVDATPPSVYLRAKERQLKAAAF